MPEKFLVALDGSELSKPVLAMLKLYLQPTSTVVMAHVIANAGSDPDVAAGHPQIDTDIVPHQPLEQLQAYQSSLPCKSTIELVMGNPAEEIVRLANIHQVDLIVIGSRGLIGINRILQGSVSSEVVETAPCSVLVVKVK